MTTEHPLQTITPVALRPLQSALDQPDWPLQFESLVRTLRQCSRPHREQRPAQPELVLRQRLREAIAQLEQLQDCLLRERAWREQLQAMLQAGAHREAQCRYRADHDALTDLPNRAAFVQHLQEVLHRVRQQPAGGPVLSVMMIDLDHFKPVNDQHGHAAGDQLLRIVGARLRHAVRAGDLVGRLGGDEFAVMVLDGSNPQALTQWATKLCSAVAAPFQVGEQTLSVTASIGIARYPLDGPDADALLAAADGAMYRAKRRGGGQALAPSGP